MLKNHFLYERVCHYIKEEWLNVRRTNIRKQNYSGNKSCIDICLKFGLCSRDWSESRVEKEKENKKKYWKCKISYFMGRFVNLYSVKNSNVSILFPGLSALLSYDIRQKKPWETGCQYLNSFITPGVIFFKNFPFFHYCENLQPLSVPWHIKEDFRLNVSASKWETLTFDLLRCM